MSRNIPVKEYFGPARKQAQEILMSGRRGRRDLVAGGRVWNTRDAKRVKGMSQAEPPAVQEQPSFTKAV
ncbi:MAG TPA: hypothetical protein VEU97_04180 [Ktedonobacteraceae bacterium]|nr:hypothetical protein [Ktedonobacteraceae bacterium]